LSNLQSILGSVQAGSTALAYLLVSPLGTGFAILEPVIDIGFTNLAMPS
jgi:hypothetical protein